MSLPDVRPLQEGLPFGVRLGGITRALLESEAARREIDDLFVAHGMIVFEGVEESDAMQLAISNCFGPLKEHPVKSLARVDGERMPGVIELHTRPHSGGVVAVDGRQVSHWLPWHFDHCYNDELNRAGVLRAVKIVDEGGITGFTDGIALYRMLPEGLRARIAGKEIAYTLSTQYDHLKFGRPAQYRMIEPKPIPEAFAAQARAMPRAIHPAVWARPTGEQVLHVSLYMAEGIVGAEDPEGDTLLEEVCQEINRLAARCSYHHKWEPGQMIIWDNLRMLHAVGGNRPEDERIMYRTTIRGDYGHGRWESAPAGAQAADAMA
ncbi:MAG: TauD/TfdA family dioxygenase [Novosphingobium sp.]